MGTYKVREEDYTVPASELSNPKDLVIIVHDASFHKIHEEAVKQPDDGQIMPLKSFMDHSRLNVALRCITAPNWGIAAGAVTGRLAERGWEAAYQ